MTPCERRLALSLGKFKQRRADLHGDLKRMEQKPDGRFVGRCSCGGSVRCVRGLGRLFTWCNKCTPVRKIKGNLKRMNSQTTLATPPGVRKVGRLAEPSI